MSENKKKVLITGAAGFIGSHLVEHCTKKGHQVHGIDNLSRKGTSNNIDYLKSNYSTSFRHHLIDLNNKEVLDNFFEKFGPFDWIAHEAGQVAVTTSLVDPLGDFNSNARATLYLLEAIKSFSPLARFAFASTNKVYGKLSNHEVLEHEDHYSFDKSFPGISELQPLDFQSPYGCSKGCADQYVSEYARSFGLKTAVFRQSCIYGTRQYGLEDQGWVAWFLIATALEKPITIYGNGKQVRDLLWIDDLCDLYLRFWQSESFDWGTAINVGGGLENCLSIQQLFKFLNKNKIKPNNMSLGEWRQGDQKIFCSDNSLANQMLDWHPQTSTQEGVLKLWRWIQENKNQIEQLLINSN
jgi:CDP-paratose 2-epimerase